MYIIDTNYSQYEADFGRQNAQLGFAADSVSQGLNTAGALFVVVPTVRILSGVAGGVTGLKGSYQSDLLGSKTVDIIQSQMRANRDEVAKQIIEKMGQPTSTYPLPLAYTDLETYYRAGTFASGIIKAAEVVGANAAEARDEKADARMTTITDVNKPLATTRPFVNPRTPATAGPVATGLTPFKIRQIQKAVCVSSPSDDWGDAEAQSNLSEFFKAAGLGTPKTIGANEKNALQVAIFSVTKRHTCQEAGFNGPKAVGEAVKALAKNQHK